MHCVYCGEKISNESNFCKYCGKRVPYNNESNSDENFSHENGETLENIANFMKTIEEANSYFQNENFLQAEIYIKKAIELNKYLPTDISNKEGGLWFFLGMSLMKQFKLSEAEESFNRAKLFGFDLESINEQINILNEIKDKLHKMGIEPESNDDKWHSFIGYMNLPPNEKAFIHELGKIVTKMLQEGMPKEEIALILIQSGTFSTKSGAINFVETAIKNLEA